MQLHVLLWPNLITKVSAHTRYSSRGSSLHCSMAADLSMQPAELTAAGQILDTFQNLMPLLDPNLKLEDNPRSQKRQKPSGKQPESAPPKPKAEDASQAPVHQLLRQLTTLVIRHDQELNVQRRSDSFVMFFSRKQEGVMTLLMKETMTWHQQEQDPNSALKKDPLRQHLLKCMLTELLNRVERIGQTKDTDKLYLASVQSGLILQDKSWPYQQWCPIQKALVRSSRTPISMSKMQENITEVMEMVRVPTQIMRFSSLRAAGESPVIPWRLQVHPRADALYDLLAHLSGNSVWNTLGTNLKPHNLSQSSLATELQTHLGPRPNKGRGKGKHPGTKQAA